jgi:hypothetical protein
MIENRAFPHRRTFGPSRLAGFSSLITTNEKTSSIYLSVRSTLQLNVAGNAANDVKATNYVHEIMATC